MEGYFICKGSGDVGGKQIVSDLLTPIIPFRQLNYWRFQKKYTKFEKIFFAASSFVRLAAEIRLPKAKLPHPSSAFGLIKQLIVILPLFHVDDHFIRAFQPVVDFLEKILDPMNPEKVIQDGDAGQDEKNS